MSTQLLRFDIYPMVYRVGKSAKLSVRPVGTRPLVVKEYKFVLVSLAAGSGYSYPGITCEREYFATPDENGVLSIDCVFDMESEYYVRIYSDDNRVAQLSVYAVDLTLQAECPELVTSTCTLTAPTAEKLRGRLLRITELTDMISLQLRITEITI